MEANLYVGKCDDVEILVKYAILNGEKYIVSHIDEEIIGEDNALGSAIVEDVLNINDYYYNFCVEAEDDEDVYSTSLEIRTYIDNENLNKVSVYVHAYDKQGIKLRTRTIELKRN